jgi:hypothetical protein
MLLSQQSIEALSLIHLNDTHMQCQTQPLCMAALGSRFFLGGLHPTKSHQKTCFLSISK